MTRLSLLVGLLAIVSATGCSICCTPFDPAYPSYGGKWERTDRFEGRVGSAFHPAGPIPLDESPRLDTPTPAALEPTDGLPEPMPMLMPD